MGEDLERKEQTTAVDQTIDPRPERLMQKAWDLDFLLTNLHRWWGESTTYYADYLTIRGSDDDYYQRLMQIISNG